MTEEKEIALLDIKMLKLIIKKKMALVHEQTNRALEKKEL